MIYKLSLIGAWLFGVGISAVLVYFSYVAYELYEHFEQLEDQCEREGLKSLQKMVELEVFKYRIERLTNP